MIRRFRYKPQYPRRFQPVKKTNHDLIWAISENSKQNSQNHPKLKKYIPQHSFEDFPLSADIKKNIVAKNYLVPTAIQDQAIPVILEGSDLIGIANTGTGKTAAFLIPLINKVQNDSAEKILIVAPTRELAIQINNQFQEFAKGLSIKSALCIGGTNIKKQIFNISQKPNFLIGTPGRIKDLLNQNCLNLSQFNNVVLDEVDRMVDIGFIGDIKYFISLLPQNRQSLFFSATVPDDVKPILNSFLKNPITISVKTSNTPQSIDQQIIKVTKNGNKVEKLHELLIQDGFDKVLIFGRTKWGVQRLADELIRRGFKAGAIHGNKSQNQRQKTLNLFGASQINILLATDVASRGLDIQNVSHVINYDLPSTYEDYVHRIGRTGRAEKTGTALTFIN